ncbi:MAG TPA: hypothetical protein VHQ70_10020 [Syntrophomonadaceae bacterium]|nr:hypothetical protein [Syntrophomonadaceae bacterium]
MNIVKILIYTILTLISVCLMTAGLITVLIKMDAPYIYIVFTGVFACVALITLFVSIIVKLKSNGVATQTDNGLVENICLLGSALLGASFLPYITYFSITEHVPIIIIVFCIFALGGVVVIIRRVKQEGKDVFWDGRIRTLKFAVVVVAIFIVFLILAMIFNIPLLKWTL